MYLQFVRSRRDNGQAAPSSVNANKGRIITVSFLILSLPHWNTKEEENEERASTCSYIVWGEEKEDEAKEEIMRKI